MRPLVAPMSEGAARAKYGELPPKVKEDIRAHAAAAENTGWFSAKISLSLRVEFS